MSEQTIQNDLYSVPVTILDKYTCYSLGATTIQNLIATGQISSVNKKNKNYGKKPDVLIVSQNTKEVVIFAEFKKPSEFNTETKIEKAIEQEIDVARDINAKIYIVSDGDTFIWINPLTKKRILNEDGSEVRYKIIPKSTDAKKLAAFIEKVVLSIDSSNNQIIRFEDLDPTSLAVKISKILKRLSFASSKTSLYTFVELFVFKYLSDIQILKENNNFDYIYTLCNSSSPAEALFAYINGPRKTMKSLFPVGPDGTNIINGQMFHAEKNIKTGTYLSDDNSDITFQSVIKEFKNYEQEYGKFVNISKDFKSKLFETFMKNSDEKSEMGQFFTPLKIVDEMVRMVDVREGMSICDPACGVGKFLLEAMSSNDIDYSTINKPGGTRIKGLEKMMSGKDDITVILAKANSLIYFSKEFKDCGDNIDLIQETSNRILNDTYYMYKGILGSLENIVPEKYDLILANPPYYRSADIAKMAKEKGLYTANGMGIEGLFVEWIIKSLKKNGYANIVIPEGILSNLNNKTLKRFIRENCIVESIISLPTKAFFSTQKKTYILTLKKKSVNSMNSIDDYNVFCYLCSSIGESLDVYRHDIEDNDLHEAVNKYRMLKANGSMDFPKNEPFKSYIENDLRLKLISINYFMPDNSWIIENNWNKEELVKLSIEQEEKSGSIEEFIDLLDEANELVKRVKEELLCLK